MAQRAQRSSREPRAPGRLAHWRRTGAILRGDNTAVKAQTGPAPLVLETVIGTIRQLKGERASMLLVEQNAEMALALAEGVYVIAHGTIVFEGTPPDLRGNQQVTATYLGLGG